MPDRTNTQRARLLFDALTTSATYTGTKRAELVADADTSREYVSDVLCDLRHLCDRLGVDFADASRTAYDRHYVVELSDYEVGDWPLKPVPAQHA